MFESAMAVPRATSLIATGYGYAFRLGTYGAGNFPAAAEFSTGFAIRHGSSRSRYADGVRPSPRHLAALIVGNSLLLPIGVIAALVWANAAPQSYAPLVDKARFIVNDVGMTLFFALAAKEIAEATAPGGALHPLSKAATAIVAAIGGMVIPATIYLGLVRVMGLPQLHRGWAIPTATDIAFSFLVARWLFGRNHPAVPFLLLLAIADDAFGLVVLALFYPVDVVRPLVFASVLLAALALCLLFRRMRVRHFWPYIGVGGALSWVAFFNGGLHPALALVPIVPFVPHAARDKGMFEEPRVAGHDPLSRFAHAVRVPTEVVLFLFGLVNGGVAVRQIGDGTWIVVAALIIGKPLGISVATFARSAFRAQTPSALTSRDVVVIGFAASIGFTVALFFATAAFPNGDLLDQTKMGALFSLSAAPIAALAAMMLRVGRFARS
jgi:Na+:H+ antiporter, NhaA family